uniref:tctex1 domain-containing protein 1-B-like n=1 Tax=Styela clava TaxID=7725 RepID=UPI00193A098C|nr:tctex1 domain-containing protein 1-B-like [Styela clava]XP_039274001.1 tctex1 domain-containing protein 1-B-like [Styela clava]
MENSVKKSLIGRRGSMFDASNVFLNRPGSSVCTFAEDPSSELFTTKGQPVKFQNSYKMEPDQRFETGRVETIAKQMLTDHLEDIQYNANDCKHQCKVIADALKTEVKAMGYHRHKIIVLVNIGQIKDQGVRVGSRCLWDDKRDNWAGASFANSTLWATATIYAIYHE